MAIASTHHSPVRTTTTTEEVEPGSFYAQNVITNALWLIAGVILVLLGFRFVFAALGANPNNGFANFIYSVSHPFVAPFFSLFSYNYHYGVSRFESYTLVAALVYLVAAWLITALINLNRTTY